MSALLLIVNVQVLGRFQTYTIPKLGSAKLSAINFSETGTPFRVTGLGEFSPMYWAVVFLWAIVRKIQK
jgi:hypothetical protein